MTTYVCPACHIEFTQSGYSNHCRNSACGGGSLWLRFWSDVLLGDGCWTYTKSIKGDGYRFFRYREGGKQIQWYAHRYSYAMEHGSIPERMSVAHKCDNPACVRPDHLFLATHDENMADMNAKGRNPHIARQLGMEKAREIRSLRGVETADAVRSRYGVSVATIHNIWGGKTYREQQHLPQSGRE